MVQRLEMRGFRRAVDSYQLPDDTADAVGIVKRGRLKHKFEPYYVEQDERMSRSKSSLFL
jgi:hypothetical protein